LFTSSHSFSFLSPTSPLTLEWENEIEKRKEGKKTKKKEKEEDEVEYEIEKIEDCREKNNLKKKKKTNQYELFSTV